MTKVSGTPTIERMYMLAHAALDMNHDIWDMKSNVLKLACKHQITQTLLGSFFCSASNALVMCPLKPLPPVPSFASDSATALSTSD
jgi:hypothetical protein